MAHDDHVLYTDGEVGEVGEAVNLSGRPANARNAASKKRVRGASSS